MLLGARRRRVSFAQQLARSSSTGVPVSHHSRCGLLRPAPPLPSEDSADSEGDFFRKRRRATLPQTVGSLHTACAVGDVEATKQLLRRGGAEGLLRAQDAELGWSALHQAAAHRQPVVVAALLESGAPPDLEDDFGMTALHLAAEEGCGETAELLVARVRERRGSVEYLAERTGHGELGERLAAYWEIVAEIEKQQGQSAPAPGPTSSAAEPGAPGQEGQEGQLTSPSPSSPPSSPRSPAEMAASPAAERSFSERGLDESDLDTSLGAIRTVSASQLPPPPPAAAGGPESAPQGAAVWAPEPEPEPRRLPDSVPLRQTQLSQTPRAAFGPADPSAAAERYQPPPQQQARRPPLEPYNQQSYEWGSISTEPAAPPAFAPTSAQQQLKQHQPQHRPQHQPQRYGPVEPARGAHVSARGAAGYYTPAQTQAQAQARGAGLARPSVAAASGAALYSGRARVVSTYEI